MKAWTNSQSFTYSAGTETMHIGSCVVRLGEGHIEVAYDYDDGGQQATRVYEGAESGAGHFRLRSRDGHGDATLHCFPESRILDGWWREEGLEGMWRIRLGE